VAFTGGLSCYTPGGPRYGGGASQRSQSPACVDTYSGPLTQYWLNSYLFADWPADSPRPAPFPAPRQWLIGDPYDMAPYDGFAVVTRTGVLENGQCNYDKGTGWTCAPGNCLMWVPHFISPAQSPVDWGPYLANVAGGLQAGAGSIGSAPADKTVVNLDTCFWIDNVQVPQERDLQLVLAGAPDASGFRIYYTLLIKVRSGGVQWFFDDPSGDNSEAVPLPEACRNHPFGTAHRYRKLTEGLPQNQAHVTARETYYISADVYWIDSFGPNHETVSPAVPPQVITPDAHPVLVGQIEGVPTG
jgi:hypothetical protein